MNKNSKNLSVFRITSNTDSYIFTHLQLLLFLLVEFFNAKIRRSISYSSLAKINWKFILPLFFIISIPFAPDSGVQISSIDSSTFNTSVVNQRQFGVSIFTPMNLLILPLFLIWIKNLGQSKLKFFIFEILLLIFYLLCILSGIFSINLSANLVWLLKLTVGLIIYLIFSTYKFNNNLTSILTKSIFSIVMIEFLLVFGQFFANNFVGTFLESESKVAIERIQYFVNNTSYFRSVGSFSHPNMLAVFCAMIMPYLMIYVIRATKRRLLGYIIFGLSSWMILLTLSRSGIITAVISCALLIVLVNKFKLFPINTLFKPIKLLTYVFVFITIFLLYNPFVYNRFINTSISERTLTTRLELNQVAFDIIRQSPFWGVGGGAFPIYLANYDTSPEEISQKNYYNIHNLYLTLLAENGLFATVFFLLFVLMVIFCTFVKVEYLKKDDKILLITLLVMISAFFINGFFEPRSFSDRIAFFFWILLGLLVNRLRQNKLLPVTKLPQPSHSFFLFLISSSSLISPLRNLFRKRFFSN